MATSFEVIYLGSGPLIDPSEGNNISENASALVGSTYGGTGDPLAENVHTFSPGSSGFSGGTSTAYDTNNNFSNDRFRIDGGADQTFDGLGIYNATITYLDGTTATITAVVLQDTAGNLYLAPEITNNTDQIALEAQPIISLKVDSLSSNDASLDGNRYPGKFARIVDGSGGDENMVSGYSDADGDSITSGNDYIFGNAGNDTIIAGDGNDVISGGDGNDSLGSYGSEGGNDRISGGGGADTMVGGGGNDTLFGDAGDDVIAGGTGDDLLFGGDGADLFTISDDHNGDTIEGGEGGTDFDAIAFADVISSLGVNVSFTATGAGTYTFNGTTGTGSFTEIEAIYGSAHKDQINASADSGGLLLTGNGGDDSITGGSGADVIDGGSGKDTLIGGGGNDTIEGGERSDTIFGGSGDDLITDSGTTLSDDTIYGEAGNDTIRGGLREDLLDGGADADTFIVEDAFGADTIIGGEAVSTGIDRDLIDFSTVTVGVTVTYSGSEAGSASDGTDTLGFSQIEALTLTNQGDTVNAGADTAGVNVDGGGGRDSLIGGSGSDTLLGGDERDSLDGGAGNDLLDGGAGNDSFITSADADTILGGTGRDSYTALDGFNGDVIDLGGHENVINDGILSEFVSFYNVTTAVDIVFDSALGGTATSAAGDTLTFDNVDGFDLAWGVGGTFDASLAGFDVILYDYGGGTSVIGSAFDDSLLAFGADPLGLTNRFYDGGAGNDYLDTGDGNDTVFGGTGADTVIARGGNDEVIGGAGNDSLQGNDGSDTVFGGTGSDTLDGGSEDDDLVMGSGDIGFGGTGDDAFYLYDIEGIGGSATVVGGEGDEGGADLTNGSLGDVLQLDWDGLGVVTDAYTIVFSGDEAGTVTGSDTDVTFSQIEVIWTGDGADTIDLSLDSSGMRILAEGGNDSISGGSGDDAMFGGLGADAISGGGGNDSIEGEAGSDTLFGDGGNDSLVGGDGDDHILGGAGADTMWGDAGSDAFFIGDADGTDIVFAGEDAGDVDSLVFDNNGTALGVSISFAGWESGTYSFGGSSGTFYEIETILTTAYNDTIDANSDLSGMTIDLDAGDDSLAGGGGNDIFFGGLGADTIAGGDGDDYIEGGAGDDFLTTGRGRDTLIGGDGDDTLMNSTGDDSLVGGGWQ